ncbi:MAG: hypothetical protein M1818_005457 [Claussenomyces sp. TS43310]|nr:MAG: hypothetical protein M1818_005457 [Claussenomyces sp. TS43310]
MAVSKGMYDIRLHRLNVMSHMIIVGLIHNRCLTIKDGVFDNSAALTLMSNDVEQIMFSADLFHELWSQTFELCIGMYLLASELGWVCIVPLLIVVFTSQGCKFVTAHIADRQKAVSMATQIRISIIKAILDSIKNIKMMGLIDKMEGKIQAARDHEIEMYINLNWLFVAFNASATMLTIFSPAVTLIIYAIQAELRGAKSIDVNEAFTSLAIISMVTNPANTVLVMMAHVASAIASFDRIQKYLASPDREDKRETQKRVRKRFQQPSPTDGSDIDDLAISIGDATIRPASTANPVLWNINTTMKKGSLIVCSGVVGTGKTTLARALLGDLPPDTGTIKTAFGLIAYCSQTPWLINGTIKDIIRGPLGNSSEVDQAWYKRVVQACDLDEDLHQLPDGDQTVIGSRGITLSGGQKHRVALARAVYAHQNMAILDDVLSALDATTESHIVNSLIGPKGLFKELGSTVLLITHATQHLPLADQIIVLGEDGKIAEQGSWDDLRTKAGYISRVVLKEKHKYLERSHDDTEAKDTTWSSAAKKSDQNLQDLTRKTGDLTLYGYYFRAIGSYRLILLLSSTTSYSLFLGLMPYWLRRWAESGGQNKWYYSGIYFLLTLGAADTLMIDRRLPPSLLQVCQCLFTLLSQSILLAVVQPLMALTLPFTFLTVYLIQKFYLATSRQLRFLDLETKALVNTSFLETLEGVATIRAFGWQRPFIDDNVKKLDLSLRPWYLMMCLQRWLNVTMDLIVLGIAMLVVSLAVGFKGTTTGG